MMRNILNGLWPSANTVLVISFHTLISMNVIFNIYNSKHKIHCKKKKNKYSIFMARQLLAMYIESVQSKEV